MATHGFDPAGLLAAVLDSSADAITSERLDGTITSWNRAAERIFGYTAAEVIGRGAQLVTPPDCMAEEKNVLARVAHGESIDHYQSVRLRRDGSRLAVSVTVAPIRAADGEVVGASRISRAVPVFNQSGRDTFRLAAIVESSNSAIISKDLDGTIQTWNRGAERLFGYAASEAIGRAISLIIPADRMDEEADVLRRLRNGEVVAHFDTVRVAKDGRHLDLSVTVSPVRTSTGKIIGASKIARDISDQKRLGRQLERANRLKDEFLATLSHELRTPLNAILGYARMLQGACLQGDDRERGFEVVERNAQSLTRLVSDVLEVSRIITGDIRLDVQSCDVGQIVNSAIESLRPMIDAKGIQLDRFLGVVTAPISGDPNRLHQVVWHLLTNAVKFTPQGGRVEVRLAQVERHVELTIRDSGIGIGAEFLPHLFERFTQADSRTTREYGGLGLGLALVRHFVELHGGSVHAFSAGTNRGATFRVNLPVIPVGPRPAPGEDRGPGAAEFGVEDAPAEAH